jgi:hypothetical protein
MKSNCDRKYVILEITLTACAFGEWSQIAMKAWSKARAVNTAIEVSHILFLT